MLPPGDAGYPGIGHTLTFHANPRRFIADRLESSIREHGKAIPVVRAKVLGRNVAVLLSYNDAARAILGIEGRVKPSARAVYKPLMADFFPDPNLLLHDEDEDTWKEWREEISHALANSNTTRSIEVTIKKHIDSWKQQDQVHLYAALKDLCFELTLSIFLGFNDQHGWYQDARKYSESMLKGQFSIPLGVNTWIYKSPRTKGLEAKMKMETIVDSVKNTCPFAQHQTPALQSHLLLFSGSLVVKAMSSYLTAMLLQMTLPSTEDLRASLSSGKQDAIPSFLLEVERISPPIIGCLRRTPVSFDCGDVEVPAGWDIWTYFPAVNRDTAVYGSDANIFKADRFDGKNLCPPMSLGYGPKSCMGPGLVRSIATSLLCELFLIQKVNLKLKSELEPGVLDWLGQAPSEDLDTGPKSDMKQLPTQRPREPIFVSFNVS